MSLIKNMKSAKKVLDNEIKHRTKHSEGQKAEYMKEILKRKAEKEYICSYTENTTFEERELYLYNHKGWLCGYFEDDYTSTDLILMRIFQKEAKGILLGDCNINDLDYFKYKLDKYKKPPVIEKLSGENLIGRQLFLDYFRNDFPKNLNYIRDYGDYMVCELDHLYKKKIYHTNLTLAYYACYNDQVKVIFSSPNKLLHLEDLALNLTLEELQYLFIQNLEGVKLKGKYFGVLPALNSVDFMRNFKNISQEIHTEKLFDKKCQYAASVFRKLHKIYNHNILFMPNPLVGKTYEHM